MPTIFRKAVLIIPLLLLASGAVYFAARQWLSARFANELTAAAAAGGAALKFQSFTAGAAGLQVDGLNVALTAQKVPFSLLIDSLSLTPSWSSLFSGTLDFDLSGRLYGGKLTGAGRYDFRQGRLSGTLAVEKLDASQHLALRALGVNAGSLNVTLTRFTLAAVSAGRPALEEAVFKLALSGFDRPAPKIFNVSAFLPVALPAFNDLNLELECEGRAREMTCARIESSSNLGTFTGQGGIKNIGAEGIISLAADISLSQDGQRAFGGFLPLLSGGRVPATQGIFAVELSGPLNRPRWAMTGY